MADFPAAGISRTVCLGEEGFKTVKELQKNGVKFWHMTGELSAKESISSGNPELLCLRSLQKEKLLKGNEIKRKIEGESEKLALLKLAYSRFFLDGEEFRSFVKSGVAEAYALYKTAETVFGDTWEEGVKNREAEALEKLRTDYHEEYLFWQFLQFEFHRQWTKLKEYAYRRGVKFVGEERPLGVADEWAGGLSEESRKEIDFSRFDAVFIGDKLCFLGGETLETAYLLNAFTGTGEEGEPLENYEKGVCFTSDGSLANFVKSLSAEEFILFRSRVAKALDEKELSVKLTEAENSFIRALSILCLASKAKIAFVPTSDLPDSSPLNMRELKINIKRYGR